MPVTYKKLWKLLIDRNMKKKELMALTGIKPYTMARMNKGENISVETLALICNALNCGFDEIMEIDCEKTNN